MEAISAGVAVLAAMSVFVNPDFEDVSKYGKPDKCVEIGRFGYNGNGGVKISPGKRYAFVFGNEVDGVQQGVVDASDFALEIPQDGTKHSLNVSVSVGVVLWQWRSRRP